MLNYDLCTEIHIYLQNVVNSIQNECDDFCILDGQHFTQWPDHVTLHAIGNLLHGPSRGQIGYHPHSLLLALEVALFHQRPSKIYCWNALNWSTFTWSPLILITNYLTLVNSIFQTTTAAPVPITNTIILYYTMWGSTKIKYKKSTMKSLWCNINTLKLLTISTYSLFYLEYKV